MLYPGIFFRGGGSTYSVKGRGKIEQRSGGGSPLVRGSAQFANGLDPYSYYIVTDVLPMELGIRLSFVKTLEFQGGGVEPPQTPHPFGTPLLSR
jgi:hypothetical protein